MWDVVAQMFPFIIGAGFLIAAGGIWGWVHTTRLRIQNGYPLEGMWGQSLKPASDGQTAERVRLLTQENAQLHAELGAMKDRLANVERIVTDSGFQLTHEFTRLGREADKVQ